LQFSEDEFWEHSKNKKKRNAALIAGLEYVAEGERRKRGNFAHRLGEKFPWAFQEMEIKIAFFNDLFHMSDFTYDLNTSLARLAQWNQSVHRYDESLRLIELHFVFDPNDTLAMYNHREAANTRNNLEKKALPTSRHLKLDLSDVDSTPDDIPSPEASQQVFYNWVYKQLLQGEPTGFSFDEFMNSRALATLRFVRKFLTELPEGYSEIIESNTASRAFIDFMCASMRAGITRSEVLKSAALGDKPGLYWARELFLEGDGQAAAILGAYYAELVDDNPDGVRDIKDASKLFLNVANNFK
jgi:hypothetical protein